MLLDRRSFRCQRSAALLTGCATVGSARPARLADCSPLPPVKVDEGRVIRTVAGLRPYRASGFVVRAEPLGDKSLVHNYGHGGAGITLELGKLEAGDRPRPAGPQRSGRGDRRRRAGPDDGQAGAGSRVSGHHLCQGPAAATRPPTSPAGRFRPSAISARDAVTPSLEAAVHGRRWITAGAAGRSWSATIMGSAGCRPTRKSSRPVAEAIGWIAYYPDGADSCRRAEHPFPIDNVVRFDTHVCRNRPLPSPD